MNLGRELSFCFVKGEKLTISISEMKNSGSSVIFFMTATDGVFTELS